MEVVNKARFWKFYKERLPEERVHLGGAGEWLETEETNKHCASTSLNRGRCENPTSQQRTSSL